MMNFIKRLFGNKCSKCELKYAYVYKQGTDKYVIEKIKNAKPGDFIEMTGEEFRQVLNICKLPMEIG